MPIHPRPVCETRHHPRSASGVVVESAPCAKFKARSNGRHITHCDNPLASSRRKALDASTQHGSRQSVKPPRETPAVVFISRPLQPRSGCYSPLSHGKAPRAQRKSSGHMAIGGGAVDVTAPKPISPQPENPCKTGSLQRKLDRS